MKNERNGQAMPQKQDGVAQVAAFFPPSLWQAVNALPEAQRATLREIRLRCGRPVGLYDGIRETVLAGVTAVSQAMLTDILRGLCRDSLHSYARELQAGFLTLPGGHRVGLCGTAVLREGRLESIKTVSGMNFRIARALPGCGDKLYQSMFGAGLCSMLLLGAPGSGKTTILRDLCRQLGASYRVAVVDERGELGAVNQGVPQHPIGQMTDVLDGYPKAEGLSIAVRVLAPQLLVCDEIGGDADTEALLAAMHTGVKLLATAHAGSIAEAERRPNLRRLLEAGAFSCLVQLGQGARVGQVVEVRRR